MKGYEQNYLGLVYKLKDCDLAEAAGRLGLEIRPDNSLSVFFLGREYIITNDGVETADGEPVNVNNKSLLLFYTTSEGKAQPANEFSQLHAFSFGLISSTSNSKMTTPLLNEFGDDYEKFARALKVFGAVYSGSPRSGEHVWTYGLLPKIPCQIVYIESDEDFPCEIKVLLDNNASCFMEFEQMAFLIGSLSDELVKISSLSNSCGA